MASPGRRDGPCEARWPPSRYGRQRPGKPCIRLVQNPSAHVHSRRLESLTTITTDEFIQKEMFVNDDGTSPPSVPTSAHPAHFLFEPGGSWPVRVAGRRTPAAARGH